MNKRILMFGWEFPPYNSGGLGVACLGLTQSLVKEGVQVTFVLPRKMDYTYNYMRFRFADTKTIITKEFFEKYQAILNPYSVLSNEKGLRDCIHSFSLGALNGDIYSQVLTYALMSKDIIEEEEYDLIHCHDWLTVEAGLLAKKITGKPLILHMHATEFDRTGGQVNQLIYDIERKGLHLADRIIAVSKFTKETIIKYYGIDECKIDVVHNGIDYYIEKHGKKDEELIKNLEGFKALGKKIVLFTGRFTIQKGAEYLLYAAQKVCSHDENILFIMAGSGDMEERLLYLTATLGLSNKVIFPGFVRDEKLKSLYAAADLFIMPSVNEPFGIVALEAMVHETPVVVSKKSGVIEVIHHALKVDFWDTEEMANLILSVLNHETLYSMLREHGHSEVRNVTWKRAATKVCEVYHDLSA